MKQTAVEFIVKQLDCLNKERKDKLISAETFFNHKINLIEEAKRMEKQQRSYSEEEVILLLQKALTHQDDGEIGSLVTSQG